MARSQERSLPFPLNGDCRFFFSARYALYHGLAALNLRPGEEVFVPAYCCGTELAPLLAYGLRLVWYGVNEKLEVDMAELERKYSPSIKALLLIHYLGFDLLSERLAEFCRKRELLLLEDCAHALLSTEPRGTPLGARGDLAVFSLRKSLPVLDGGVLYLRSGSPSRMPQEALKPNFLVSFFRRCDLLAGSSALSPGLLPTIGTGFARGVGSLFGKGKRLCWALNERFSLAHASTLDPNSYVFDPVALEWTMSTYTGRALARQDWCRAVEQRRDNFGCLLEGMKKISVLQPLIATLPRGTCPLFFPLIVRDREQLHRYLARCRIDAAKWWSCFHPAVPWPEYPAAVALKRELLGIPIHQGLGLRHMEAILEALRRWGRSH